MDNAAVRASEPELTDEAGPEVVLGWEVEFVSASVESASLPRERRWEFVRVRSHPPELKVN
jgi:hypothetical protein